MPLLITFSGAHVGSHSSLEERISFFESVDVEANSVLALIAHAEVEPLSVSSSVRVDTHVEIILTFCHPHIPTTIPQRRDSDSHFQTDC